MQAGFRDASHASGICRGCQVMNVVAGGGMVQHFDGHRSPKEGPFYHDVVAARSGRFRDAVGQDVISVNTITTKA